MGLFRREIPETNYRGLELMLGSIKTPEDLSRFKEAFKKYEEKYSMKKFKDEHDLDIETFESLFKYGEKIK